jgi:cell division protein FtsQ
MSQTIRRSGPSARRVAAKAQSARKVEAAKARTGSLLDVILSWLPFSERQLHRIFLALILAGAGALLWLVASLAGVPAMAEERVAALTARAGFAVRRVEVHGVKHINELQVYDRVLGVQGRQAMTRLDLAAVRADLLQLSWVEDARVSRQLPDTLVIDITERKPHAVMRLRNADGSDSFVLIDATGHELEGITASRAKGRLVLAGEGAEGKVADLAALLDAAPALRPQVAEAEWIGHRRWNLTFKSGQTLELPEGADVAAKALVKFAQYDGTNQLIGGQVMAFDMRSPDRIYMRVPGLHADAASAVAGTAALAVGAAVAHHVIAEKPKVHTEKSAVKPAGATTAHAKPEHKTETKPKPKDTHAKDTHAKTEHKTDPKPKPKPAHKAKD